MTNLKAFKRSSKTKATTICQLIKTKVSKRKLFIISIKIQKKVQKNKEKSLKKSFILRENKTQAKMKSPKWIMK